MIVTDGDRVLQIISNLLSNAFRWTPEGGRIELALAAENGAVTVSVADSGPGVTAEERERIFRPFWSRDGSGTGLGLAIARELAVALGGRIELHSEPGRGQPLRGRAPVRAACGASSASAGVRLGRAALVHLVDDGAAVTLEGLSRSRRGAGRRCASRR